jgi:hypothetical protein
MAALSVRKPTARGTIPGLDAFFSRKSKHADTSALLKLADEEGVGEEMRKLLAARQPNADVLQFPLDWASKKGHAKLVKLLLADSRCNPSSASIDDACKLGHLDVISLLLADPRVYLHPDTITEATRSGRVEVVKLLLKSLPHLDPVPVLRTGAFSGRLEIAKLLLASERLDPSVTALEVLHNASLRGHLDIIKFLLADERVDPSINDQHLIRSALSGQGFFLRVPRLDSVVVLLSDPRVTVPTDELRDDRPILMALMLLRRSFRQNISFDPNLSSEFKSLITEIESIESKRRSLLGAHLIPDLVGLCLDYVPDLFSHYVPKPVSVGKYFLGQRFCMDLSEASLYISFASLSTM